jgi:hypothetical protein
MTEQLRLFDLPEVEVNKEKPHSVCPKCGGAFVSRSKGVQPYCHPCLSKYHKVLRSLTKANPRPTDPDYCCAICGKQEKDLVSNFTKRSTGGVRKSVWRLDHDHVTGEFRGFLCDNCNMGVGKLKDDPEIILKALWYTKTNNGNAELSEQHLVEWCYNILSNICKEKDNAADNEECMQEDSG